MVNPVGSASIKLPTPMGCGVDSKDQLLQIERLNGISQAARAEDRVAHLIQHGLSRPELIEHYDELAATIGHFFKKRQSRLLDLLNARIAEGEEAEKVRTRPAQGTRLTQQDLLRRLHSQLIELSDRHIFQWGTHYRYAVEDTFDEAWQLLTKVTQDLDEGIIEEFEAHSTEISPRGTSMLRERLAMRCCLWKRQRVGLLHS